MENGTSRLARALWIEIIILSGYALGYSSRLARALWIEIKGRRRIDKHPVSRGSREPCGLKSSGVYNVVKEDGSRGSREPCGLKWVRLLNSPNLSCVEARESLVD